MRGPGFKGDDVTELLRHVAAAAALRLPSHYRPLRLGGEDIGFVTSTVADALQHQVFAAAGNAMVLDDASALARAQATLAAAGLLRLRGEAFDVRATPGGPVLGQVDRGALPVFGIAAEGVHVNGLVRGDEGWRLWVARRAATKLLDPGKLDHMVAGGICAGMDAAGTVAKEAGEEAGVPPGLARQARLAGVITYAMERPEGLRRDRLYCYDLEVPPDFAPAPRDGEVESFSLMRLDEVLARVRDTDDFKFNVNLVLIQLFVRLGLADAETFAAEGREIGIVS
jgi:8-oxo-dGTP pyrophosphatase MutT (NUDIX family)